MERNENGYSAYNLAPDSARGGRCVGGCQQGSGRSSGNGCASCGDDGRRADRFANGNGCHGNGGSGTTGGAQGGSPVGSGSMSGVAGRLAMAYVPMQTWRMLYAPDYALTRGSLFEELDLPLEECTNG